MEMLRQSKIGFVEQDAPLIEGTILYNLYPSKTQEDYSANEILRAKEMVDIFGLHDRISKSCDGLNMRIDEKNHLLSGGERQKIAIIRELLKQPSLLLLDEPTASMDQTSAEILLNELNSINCLCLLCNDIKYFFQQRFFCIVGHKISESLFTKF